MKRALAVLGAGLVFVVCAPLLVLWWISPGTTPPIVGGDGNPLPRSVAEIDFVELGGLKQFVVLRGSDTRNPVLLLLHGGPGDPQAPHFNTYNRALEDHFVVVSWDQRGAGRSKPEDLSPQTMTVAQLVSDTHELTQHLKRRFAVDRILLLGHSWGSYLGVRTVYRHPEDYFAYVGVWQVANQQRSETLSYQWALAQARKRNRSDAVDELEAMGPPARGRYAGGLKDFGRQRRWVREFGGAAHGLDNRQVLWLFAKPLLLPRVPRSRQAPRISGWRGLLDGASGRADAGRRSHRHGGRTPGADLLLAGPARSSDGLQRDPRILRAARSAAQGFVEFEQSAHLVPYEEPEKFNEFLVARVRPLALSLGSAEPATVR